MLRPLQEIRYSFSDISPWETQNSTDNFNTIFDPYASSFKNDAKKIHSSKKSMSKKFQRNTTSNLKRKTILTPIENNNFRDKNLSNNVEQVLKEFKQNKENRQNKDRVTKSASKCGKFQTLQQIGIRKFVVQGQNRNNKQNGYHMKKKQSSFVKKQKFSDIRKSLNIPGSNLIIKQVKDYILKRQDKENPLLNFFSPSY